jgi:hypothetical protein
MTSTYNPGYRDMGDSPVTDDLIGSNAADLLAQKFTLDTDEVLVRGMVVSVSGSTASRSMSGDTPFGICAQDADETAGDTEVLVFVRGSFNAREVERKLLVKAGDDGWIDSGLTIDGIRETLRDKGIYLEWPVRRYPDV